MLVCKVPALLLISFLLQGALASASGVIVPYQERWGIYELDLQAPRIRLIYTSPDRVSGLRLDGAGTAFVFSQRIGGDEAADEEICTLGVDGTGFRRLTDNAYLDTYPAWSPDGSRIAFLSWRGETLDVYVMDADAGDAGLLYDSGFHDADIHWVGDRIAFTRNSQIWTRTAPGRPRSPIPRRRGSGGRPSSPSGTTTPA
jgi:Tol biopolymer transport system component